MTDDGWDNHSGIYNILRRKVPGVDSAVASLIEDLDGRGLLDETLVVLMGEFGRTPQFNTSSDLAATIYKLIGIEPDREFHTGDGSAYFLVISAVLSTSDFADCLVPSGQRISISTGSVLVPSPKCRVRSFWLPSPVAPSTCRVIRQLPTCTRTCAPIAKAFTPSPWSRTFNQ